MSVKYLSTKEIQKEELKMLIAIVEFLDKRNINYYLYGGTLLGAIRHKGFIPWDDDIDLILARPDYDKLIFELKKKKCHIKDDIEAIGYELGNNDDWPFIKIINKSIVLDNERKSDKNLWIDIFVYDGIPDNSFWYFTKIRLLRKVFFEKRFITNGGKEPNRSVIKRMVDFIFRTISLPFSKKAILKRYVSLCKKYSFENCNYIYDNIWGLNYKKRIKKDLLISSEYEFEKSKFKSFKDYDTILTNFYGDYMELPPKDQQVTHEFKARRIK